MDALHTATPQRPLSRTEIAMRVRGIIADAMGRAPVDCPESLSTIDLRMDEYDALAILVRIEESFDIQLGTDFEARLVQGSSIGWLIDSVEGQVKAERIS